MATKLEKVTIKLPSNAFFQQKCRPKEFFVKVGDDCRPLHNFFLGTNSNFTHQQPVNNPSVYHFSVVGCRHPEFKRSSVITISIERGVVHEIIERLPFEAPVKI
jgi:hypothetical protein